MALRIGSPRSRRATFSANSRVVSSRISGKPPGHVRHDPQVRRVPERAVGRQRLAREDVEGRAGQPALAQRIDERGLIHDAPARQVHEQRARLHAPETLAREQAACLVGEREQQHHHVGLREHDVRPRRRLDARHRRMRLRRALRADHAHAERRGLHGERLADRAEPEDAERLPGRARRQRALPGVLTLRVHEERAAASAARARA